MKSLLFLFWTGSAFAQAPAQQSGFASMIPLVLIFVVFYFLMIRPQKKKFQQEQDYLKGLKKDDEVYTKSGILGTIRGMTDTTITLEVAEGVKIKVIRSQVAGSAKSLTAPVVVDNGAKS